MLNPISIAAFALWDLVIYTPTAVRKVEALLDLRRGKKAELRGIVRLEICVSSDEFLAIADLPSVRDALDRADVLKDTHALPRCGHCGAAEALS